MELTNLIIIILAILTGLVGVVLSIRNSIRIHKANLTIRGAVFEKREYILNHLNSNGLCITRNKRTLSILRLDEFNDLKGYIFNLSKKNSNKHSREAMNELLFPENHVNTEYINHLFKICFIDYEVHIFD